MKVTISLIQKHLEELENNDLIPLKYCDKKGNIILESNQMDR